MNPLEKENHTVLIAPVWIGSVAAAPLDSLFLAEIGEEDKVKKHGQKLRLSLTVWLMSVKLFPNVCPLELMTTKRA